MAKIEIEQEQLDTLLSRIEEQNADIKKLYDGSMKILELLGLAENGLAKTECFTGEENAMPNIIKGAGSLFTLLTQSQIPIMGKRAEAKLVEKFSFFATMVPIFEKYGKEFYHGK